MLKLRSQAGLHLTIIGGGGKMGRRVAECAAKDKDLSLLSLLVKPDQKELSIPSHPKVEVVTSLSPLLEKSDLFLDFSSPDALSTYLPDLIKAKKPLLVGTTGYNDKQYKLLKKASRSLPLFYSPNFSFGVAILLQCIDKVASHFPGSEVQIAEVHHVEKKDGPSGTAKNMAERVQGQCKIRFISFAREGSVIGTHSILFHLPNEEITLAHKALDRSLFAQGALRAAKWLVKQAPGLYGMEDLIQ